MDCLGDVDCCIARGAAALLYVDRVPEELAYWPEKSQIEGEREYQYHDVLETSRSYIVFFCDAYAIQNVRHDAAVLSREGSTLGGEGVQPKDPRRGRQSAAV